MGITITIGRVAGVCGQSLEIKLHIDEHGQGYVAVTGQSAMLMRGQHWEAFKALVLQCDATIERLKKTGELKYVVDEFALVD